MKDKSGRQLQRNRSGELLRGELQCMKCGEFSAKENFYPDETIEIPTRTPDRLWLKLHLSQAKPQDSIMSLSKTWGITPQDVQNLLNQGRIRLDGIRPHVVSLPYEVQSYCFGCRTAPKTEIRIKPQPNLADEPCFGNRKYEDSYARGVLACIRCHKEYPIAHFQLPEGRPARLRPDPCNWWLLFWHYAPNGTGRHLNGVGPPHGYPTLSEFWKPLLGTSVPPEIISAAVTNDRIHFADDQDPLTYVVAHPWEESAFCEKCRYCYDDTQTTECLTDHLTDEPPWLRWRWKHERIQPKAAGCPARRGCRDET